MTLAYTSDSPKLLLALSPIIVNAILITMMMLYQEGWIYLNFSLYGVYDSIYDHKLCISQEFFVCFLYLPFNAMNTFVLDKKNFTIPGSSSY